MGAVESETLLARLAAALRGRPEVLEAQLFGSTARGEAGRTAARAAEIGADLGAAVGGNAIDVVALNAASPLLYHRVLRDGIRLISRDLEATTRRAGQALSRYCDYLPQLAKIGVPQRRMGQGRGERLR